MKQQDLPKTQNLDLRASLAAMQRAVELVRRTASQTDMAIVVVQNVKLVRIPAEQLRNGEST